MKREANFRIWMIILCIQPQIVFSQLNSYQIEGTWEVIEKQNDKETNQKVPFVIHERICFKRCMAVLTWSSGPGGSSIISRGFYEIVDDIIIFTIYDQIELDMNAGFVSNYKSKLNKEMRMKIDEAQRDGETKCSLYYEKKRLRRVNLNCPIKRNYMDWLKSTEEHEFKKAEARRWIKEMKRENKRISKRLKKEDKCI